MNLGARFKRGQAVLDALRKTSTHRKSSNRSSTPIEPVPPSMSEISSSSGTTLKGQVSFLNTQSTSSVTGSVSSAESRSLPINPEQEGECEIPFTLTVKTYGHYKKAEHDVAHALAIALYRTFGVDSWELRDELGRIVLFDLNAGFGSPEQIHYVEGPK